MRKLQYVFMALAVLCFAVPVFADGGTARSQPGSDRRRHRHGPGGRPLRPGSGQGSRLRPSKRWPATPGPARGIMIFLVLGLAFIESLTLFTLVIVFAKM